MKVATTSKQATKGSTVYQAMPLAMQLTLKGLTINQAIEAGLITDLADDKGVFIKKSNKADAHYAIVNNTVVRCSKGVSDALEAVPEQIGDLKFLAGTSNVEGDGFGKEWFRLSLPQGYDLSEDETEQVRLNLEPAEA